MVIVIHPSLPSWWIFCWLISCSQVTLIFFIVYVILRSLAVIWLISQFSEHFHAWLSEDPLKHISVLGLERWFSREGAYCASIRTWVGIRAPVKKLDVAVCTSKPRAVVSRDKSVAGACWLPAQFQVQQEILSQKNKVRSDRLDTLLWPPYMCTQGHLPRPPPPQMCTYNTQSPKSKY